MKESKGKKKVKSDKPNASAPSVKGLEPVTLGQKKKS
jgi:hypothetical protein